MDKSGLFESTSYLQGTKSNGAGGQSVLPNTTWVLELRQDPCTPKNRLSCSRYFWESWLEMQMGAFKGALSLDLGGDYTSINRCKNVS